MIAITPTHKILLAALVLVAAVYDIRFRKIPNWLCATGIAAGLALNGFIFEWPGLAQAALGLGVAALIYLPLFVLRAMGAGDVKLMMAVGSLVGWKSWLAIFVITGILGGVIALLLLLSKGLLGEKMGNVVYILKELVHLRAPYRSRPDMDVRSPTAIRLPHAAVIALGALSFLTLVVVLG